MDNKQPLVDRLLYRLRNNPITAIVILIGIVLGSMASLSDSVTRIFDVMPRLVSSTHIDGEWRSEVFTDLNVQDPSPEQYYFKFTQIGPRLVGEVGHFEPPDNPRCRVHGFDGKIDGNKISFAFEGDWISNDDSGRHLKESFYGVVGGKEIRLTYLREHAAPIEFVARKVTTSSLCTAK